MKSYLEVIGKQGPHTVAVRKIPCSLPFTPTLGLTYLVFHEKSNFCTLKVRELSIQMVEVGEIVFTGQGRSGAVRALLGGEPHVTLHTRDGPAILGPSKALREYAKGLPRVLNTLVEAMGF